MYLCMGFTVLVYTLIRGLFVRVSAGTFVWDDE